MRARYASLTVLLLALLPRGEAEAQSISRAEFDAMRTRIDNAGRWGAQDERGTVNLITDEVRRAAAREAREGVSIALGREVVPGPVEGALEPAKIEFQTASDSVLGPSDGSVRWIVDRITLLYHGYAFSHVDALSHISYEGRGYNGPATQGADLGPERNRVGALREGFFTRGVLVDVPRLRGESVVAAGTVVTPADLERWEQEAGVRIRAGDVLLLRGGRWSDAARATGASGTAAFHPTAAEWLHARGVSAVGVEGAADPPTSLVPGMSSPFHVLALVALGMPIFENLDLERLAEEAAARDRWTFLFVASPLDLRGATGAPVNPLAVF